MSLRVDEATTRRFDRACRWETMWRRRVVPTVLAVAAAILLCAIVAVLTSGWGFLMLTALIGLCLAVATCIGRATLTLQRSPRHPVLVRRGYVRMRRVEPETARAWAHLNPAGQIEIVG